MISYIVAAPAGEHKSLNDSDVDVEELTRAATSTVEPPFKNVGCESSFYVFSKTNAFRLFCWNIVTSTTFEGVIIALICLGSIKLAIDTYFLQQEDAIHKQVSLAFDLFFTSCFTLEAIMKAVAYGFMFDKGSYLRDTWNQLDFCIVVASLVDVCVAEIEIPMVKILRLFRTFRPLRFVTHNQNMRIIVTALFRSLGAILNTLVVVLVIWLMFSIVGVNFFAGKFQYCSESPYDLRHKRDCEQAGGLWRTYDHNFDNSVNGLIFLFVLTTQENWPSLVFQAIDCTDVEEASGPLTE